MLMCLLSTECRLSFIVLLLPWEEGTEEKIKIVHLGSVGSVRNSVIANFPFPLFLSVVSSRELGKDKGLIMSSKRRGDLESHEKNGLKQCKILERGKREVNPRDMKVFFFLSYLINLFYFCLSWVFIAAWAFL